jgi:Carboxypeptidase regulatory-like domain
MKMFRFGCLLSCLLFAALAMAQPNPKTLATVDGITVGPNHVPVVGARVTLMGLGGITANGGTLGQPFDATSDSEGRFSICGVEPGRYAISANHPDYSPIMPNLLDSVLAGAASSLTLTAGQHKTDLEIELVPMTILSGKVIDENGDPMANVIVRPMRAQTVLNGRLRMMHAGAAVQTGADGTFELSVYTGRWYLSFLPKPAASAAAVAPGEPERQYITTYFRGVPELPQASGIDARGFPVPGLNVRLRKTPVYHVRGKVIGSVTPNFRIVPTHEGGSGHPSGVDEGPIVHADGAFDITGLIPGADAGAMPVWAARDAGPLRAANQRCGCERFQHRGAAARRNCRDDDHGPGTEIETGIPTGSGIDGSADGARSTAGLRLHGSE